MSTPEILGVAVLPTTPSNPSSRKRKITPTAEESSSKRALILFTTKQTLSNAFPGAEIPTQPFFAPKRLFPRGVASVVRQYTHAHPSTSQSTKNDLWEDEGWHSRHILLPFNLRDPSINILSKDVIDTLRNIFPGTTDIGEASNRSQLLFKVEEMPTSPWPLTIGGLPFTIRTDSQGRALMFPAPNLGNLRVKICQEGYNIRQLSDSTLRKLAADVNQHFRENLPGIHIIEIMFTRALTFYIVLEDHVDIGDMKKKFWTQLPGRIAGRPIGYLNDKQLCRPSWADLPAKRQIEPQPAHGIFDDTAYDVMRPGVMVNSVIFKEHAHPSTHSTTSGVLVEDSTGHRFMTGSSHGIGRSIWQPKRPDVTVGEAVLELPFTDITLMKVSEDVTFENDTFESVNGVIPHFTRFVTSDDNLDFATANLNSPYTGNMEGIISIRSIRLERSSNSTEDNVKYVAYSWSYMGQVEGNDSSAQPPEGTCGSVIWDDDGLILGFFRYYIHEGHLAGHSVSVSASEVVEAGYILAK